MLSSSDLTMSKLRFLMTATFGMALSVAASGQTPAAKLPEPAPSATAPEASSTPAARAAKISFSQCNVDGPYIAMTYDDGPHGVNTPRLLEMLKQRGLKATFFVCGECVAQFPEITKHIVADGHEIANHSWSHPQLEDGRGSVTDQFQRTHDLVKPYRGRDEDHAAALRRFTPTQRAGIRNGDTKRSRDVDPLDWKVRNAAHVTSEILKHTVNGSIVPPRYPQIDGRRRRHPRWARRAGFKFVTVSG
jgi:peptidoglycan/xylan/chitin deacetylase (PgdA/CDA1 family)